MTTHSGSFLRRTWVRVLLWVLGVLFLLLAFGPFLVPVRSTGTETVFDLAGSDSRFLEIDGIRLHYRFTPRAAAHGAGPVGEPNEPPQLFVLLHGFGASTFSWREVESRLAELGDVVSYDRPGFGLTERPDAGSLLYTGAGQLHILQAILAHVGREQAILVGSSAGGTVALNFALEYASQVPALVLVSPAVYTGGGAPGLLQRLLRLPQLRRLGPLLAGRIAGDAGDEFLRNSWYDPGRITEEVFTGYRLPTRVEGWEQGLWNFATAAGGDQAPLAERVVALEVPALVITGDTDRIVPTEDSIRLAAELPEATLVVVPASGHLAHEETPDEFMQAVRLFLNQHTEQTP